MGKKTISREQRDKIYLANASKQAQDEFNSGGWILCRKCKQYDDGGGFIFWNEGAHPICDNCYDEENCEND